MCTIIFFFACGVLGAYLGAFISAMGWWPHLLFYAALAFAALWVLSARDERAISPPASNMFSDFVQPRLP